jgi:hypothetical protein
MRQKRKEIRHMKITTDEAVRPLIPGRGSRIRFHREDRWMDLEEGDLGKSLVP